MLICSLHEKHERSVRPSNRCVRCWAVWFDEQGRFDSPVQAADLARFLRDLFEIVNPELGRHLVDRATR